jgi:hypothetical protein
MKACPEEKKKKAENCLHAMNMLSNAKRSPLLMLHIYLFEKPIIIPGVISGDRK